MLFCNSLKLSENIFLEHIDIQYIFVKQLKRVLVIKKPQCTFHLHIVSWTYVYIDSVS